MYNVPPPTVDWSVVLPMIIVACGGFLALIVEIVSPKRTNNVIVGTCLGFLALAGWMLFSQITGGAAAIETFGGMVVRDQFSLVMQLLLVVVAFVSILFSEGYLREKRIPFGEFYPLVVWSTVGAMLMASSKNLLVIFLGLEVLSIALYVMAGLSRSENKSEESALKYFLLGAFASGFLLYGIAFVYGATGSLHLDAIRTAWHVGDSVTSNLLLFGLGLMLIGLCFKAAFVPFHQWTPDVYQGAPTNVTAFMAAGSKIGALAMLWRVLEGMQDLSQFWMPALFWIAILTMTIGNLIALAQKDVKRILAYSSIAHAGYILVAILAHFKGTDIGMETLMYYLLSYSLMTIGAFAVISLSAKAGQEGTQLSDLHGLYQRSPFAAGCLIVFMASLIGIPPTAGFFGKLMIFNDALNSGLTALAIVLAVNSAISIYYYLGIVKASFVSDEDALSKPSAKMNAGLATACVACTAGIFLAAFFYSPLMSLLAGR